jgi:sialate O-acetylesterase
MEPSAMLCTVTNRSAACVTLLVALAFGPARADVRLAKIFTDNMVVQRDRPIRVWGQADPGETVSVSLGGGAAETMADAKGRWLVELPARADGADLELAAKGKNNAVVLKNVIVGDVWLCSGQSNMEWNMSQSDAADDIKAAENPTIRCIKFNHVQSGVPEEDCPVAGPWRACTPQTVGSFTAVGFYFARDVVAGTGVPVGLLDDNWGGTPIEPWVAPEGMELVPEFGKALQDRAASHETFLKSLPGKLDEMDRWVAAARAAVAAGDRLPPAPGMPVHPHATGWCSMYNAMIHPIARFPIKGFLWYQGESNGGEGESYHQKMQALVRGWRKVWRDDELPFYFVQLASFQKPTDDPAGGDGWAKLREAQRRSLTIPGTGMAVITDTVPLAVAGDIHPRNKFDVGTRLARWALHHDYGKQDVVPSGPLFKALAIEGGKARVSFDHVGGGLMIGSKTGRAPVVEAPGGKLARFAVAGIDKKWHWADAVIDGDVVVVSSPQVPEPAAVRYAFSMNPDGANLYNRAGLPASPFRTDDW